MAGWRLDVHCLWLSSARLLGTGTLDPWLNTDCLQAIAQCFGWSARQLDHEGSLLVKAATYSFRKHLLYKTEIKGPKIGPESMDPRLPHLWLSSWLCAERQSRDETTLSAHDNPSANINCANARGHMDPSGPERLDPLCLHSQCLRLGTQLVHRLFFPHYNCALVMGYVISSAQFARQKQHPTWI